MYIQKEKNIIVTKGHSFVSIMNIFYYTFEILFSWLEMILSNVDI